ncbi:MAG: CusA/CzcA family heavy metal efflux RND transporter [Bacteroidia bacterium]|nr:CusA/CzcA family heavy metal efflux RND transporter [Bacteroidia bacterium]
MFEKIIGFSLGNKLIVLIMVLALILGGLYALSNIPVDAVPDITNNQVQVVTSCPTLASQEVEQYITFPVEAAMANIPQVEEIRSISRYGLSVVTIVFEENVDIMRARQFVSEQLNSAKSEISADLGVPEMMPITTGLGEIYQYVLQVQKGFQGKFTDSELRTIQDWIVKRQMAGIDGIIEVSSFGGKVKQYEVAVQPELLEANQVSLKEVTDALEMNNANSGGSYIEKGEHAYYIRTEGRAGDFASIENIVVKNINGRPVLIRDLGKVGIGSAKRYGAMTMDGKGEVVGGITLMFKGANSSEAIANVHERVEQVKKSLPQGVQILPYLDRSVLVSKTVHTVSKNLLEGGLIVIFVLVIFLGNLRAGLIVSSVIPLSMLFALIMMRFFNVSANLMSLGAIDFGIVVDGAVIIVEGVLHVLHNRHKGSQITRLQLGDTIRESAGRIYQSAAFGVLIILVVFVPIFTLKGIEGKMFLPMAQTVSFAILGSLLLSLTYVPVMSALILKTRISDKVTLADRLMKVLNSLYQPSLNLALKWPKTVVSGALLMLAFSLVVFTQMGGEFIPTLEEGDLAMQMTLEPGSSLEKSIATSTRAEKILKENFPEVVHVVSKIGTAEIPTDPMAIEDADVMIILKESEEWVSATSREELITKMKEKLEEVSDASFEFTQPIQLRFNELITGAKTDIAVKIFGEDMGELEKQAHQAADIIRGIPGAGDVKVEQTEGLNQISLKINRPMLSLNGLTVNEVNHAIRTCYAGMVAGSVYENERKFDLVARLAQKDRANISLGQIRIQNASGRLVPLSQLVETEENIGPMQISREDAKRRINIGVNVRDRDVASLVAEIQTKLDQQLKLPPGYQIHYGGQFENLQNALGRLKVAVPIALGLILFILYLAFGSAKHALLIFVTVPLSAVGGVMALQLRGMPFSISAGIGFIALFGVAVLNGLVLMNEFIRLRDKKTLELKEVVMNGSLSRLRPVLMTAVVASLGFLPMALSTTNGAEVQRPLATVVIGGLISSTLLTLLVLPVIFFLASKKGWQIGPVVKSLLILLLFLPGISFAQSTNLEGLLSRAKEQNSTLKIRELDQQTWENRARYAYKVDPADVSLQYGQINEIRNDIYVQVHQDIGRPWALKAGKEWARAGLAQSLSESELAAWEIDYEVKSRFYELQNLQERNRLLERMDSILAKSMADMQARRDAGDLSEAEYMIFSQHLFGLSNLKKQAELQSLELRSQLGKIAWLEPETEIEVPKGMPEPGLSMSRELNDLQLKPLKLQIELGQAMEKKIRQSYLPSVRIGYFHQSLSKIYGYQGVSAGLAIPVFRTGKKLELWEANAQKLEAEIRLSEREMALRHELERLESALQLTENQLKLYEANYPQRLRNAYETLLQKLQTGDITTLEFVQQGQILLQSQNDYFQFANQKVQLVLEINFLRTK